MNINSQLDFLQKDTPKYVSFYSIISTVLIWEICCRMQFIPPLFLPAPSAIVHAAKDMTTSGELVQSLTDSLYRIGIGYMIGSILGIITGLILSFSKWMNAILSPLIYIVYPIPKIALLPLIILWLGIGEFPKITIIALGVFFPVFINIFSGVKNIDSNLIKAAVLFKASRTRLLLEVMLPGALPSIFAGLKIASGTSLLLLIAAEMIAAKQGIGTLILHYGNLMLTTKLMVGVIILSILGLSFNRLLTWIETWALLQKK
ncbi:ABC transporter permease (plasmid) [Bacillus sp. FDAARGOS_1420]|nr:ABC transporter permease [Bacillus sp. FDAARGOS_1420]